MTWSGYKIFSIIDFIRLKICLYASIIVKAWLVSKTVSCDKHRLWLFINKLVRIVWTWPNWGLWYYIFQWWNFITLGLANLPIHDHFWSIGKIAWYIVRARSHLGWIVNQLTNLAKLVLNLNRTLIRIHRFDYRRQKLIWYTRYRHFKQTWIYCSCSHSWRYISNEWRCKCRPRYVSTILLKIRY